MAMSDLQMKDRMADGRIVLCGSNAYEKMCIRDSRSAVIEAQKACVEKAKGV